MRSTPRPEEVARGLLRLALGSGFMAVNAYVVRSGSSTVLVDAGWQGDAAGIVAAVEDIADGRPPAGIILTHAHPDHSGAAEELARHWGCPVWVHPRELPLALGDADALWKGTGPLDRWLILPALRALGKQRLQEVLARGNLAGAKVLDPREEPPGLPGWRVLQTPGHTPGHIALWRPEDGVLVTGDAVVTVELNSPPGVLLRTRRAASPPWISTWDWTTALASARAVLALEPSVLAGGHGDPLEGQELERSRRRYLRWA